MFVNRIAGNVRDGFIKLVRNSAKEKRMEMSNVMVKGEAVSRAESYFAAGEKYFFGNGEDKNVALAKICYIKAAKCGNASAAYMAGFIMVSGTEGKTNVRRGTAYLKKAAAKYHDGAILLLARNYYYGYGVKRNVKKAFRCWERGAEAGCAEAEYYLGLCYAKGIYVRKNLPKAKKHLTEALENGFSIARDAIDDTKYLCV